MKIIPCLVAYIRRAVGAANSLLFALFVTLHSLFNRISSVFNSLASFAATILGRALFIARSIHRTRTKR